MQQYQPAFNATLIILARLRTAWTYKFLCGAQHNPARRLIVLCHPCAGSHLHAVWHPLLCRLVCKDGKPDLAPSKYRDVFLSTIADIVATLVVVVLIETPLGRKWWVLLCLTPHWQAAAQMAAL